MVECETTIELQGQIFVLDGEQASLMTSTPAELVTTDPAALRAQFRRQGYLLMRGLLPRPQVAAVEAEIRAGLGEVQPACADTLMNSHTFRRVSNGPELFGLFDALFDSPSVTLDHKHFRAIGPGVGTPFHMDRTYMGRGSRRLTTAWIPWHDVDLRTGGLAVVGGSHSLPGFAIVRDTYGEQEVHGMLSSDPLECLSWDPAAQWLTASYKAGDVLVFPMDLLHGSCTNRNPASAPLRLSSDVRFQPRVDPVDDRNTAHGRGESYTWDERNFYYNLLGESCSRDQHAYEKLRQKRTGLGAPAYACGPPVPEDLEAAKQAWGLTSRSVAHGVSRL
eukprot:COSAG05_NODE_4109_length_1670_cov_1.790579_1_plen_334_part_00